MSQESKKVRNLKTSRWIWPSLIAIVIVGSFVGGTYVGRWAVKNEISGRIRAWLSSDGNHMDPTRYLEVTANWQQQNTALAGLEMSSIHLPHSDGWGGGIQPIEGGRILYATREGEFGVVGYNGVPTLLPFRVDMNLDALKRHPAFKLKNFKYLWVRVTDINLAQISPGRYELLVGHHYFEPKAQCMELKLSRAVLRVTGNDISLSEPFQTLLTTKPCITFFNPDSEFVFEGHFSGGRIARLSTDQVLFSTGDHGWVGLRGYPAVSQDDDSTLGKVLLVNLLTKDVSIFAKGMRNPQGLTIDSKGRIWQTEQGPRGGDELNLLVKGQNYGWPESTYGTDYAGQSGPRPWPLNAEQGRHSTGVKPQFAWNPSIGVSNLIEVTGNEFPLWKGDLLVLSLVGQAIHRLRLEGTRVVYDEPINLSSRLRDIVELPNGYLAVLTDAGTLMFLRNSENHGHEPYLDVRHQQKRTVDMSEQERAAAVAGFYAVPNRPKPNNSNHLSKAAARGEQVFKENCESCHSLDTNEGSIGPSLKNIVGRRVGSTSFPYSPALLARRETWTGRRVVDFVGHPNTIYAGTSMAPVPLAPELQMELGTYLDEVSRRPPSDTTQ